MRITYSKSTAHVVDMTTSNATHIKSAKEVPLIDLLNHAINRDNVVVTTTLEEVDFFDAEREVRKLICEFVNEYGLYIGSKYNGCYAFYRLDEYTIVTDTEFGVWHIDEYIDVSKGNGDSATDCLPIDLHHLY